MSAPVDFEGSNFTYLGPAGEDCVDLHTFKHPKGNIFAVRFTPDECAEIVKTGVVWVSIQTHNMPMIMLSAESLVTMTRADGTQYQSKAEPFIPLKLVGGLVPPEETDGQA